MKTIAIIQPYFFPYLGYFQLINAVDTFVLYGDFDYIKRGWVNRNRLLPVDGKPFYITAPVRKSSSTKIEATRIAEDRWREKTLKSIHYAYKQTPFFDDVFPVLEDSIRYDTESLSALNKYSIGRIAEYLDIATEIVTDFNSAELEDRLDEGSEALERAFPDIHLDTPSVMLVRIIALCKEFDASTFINPIGGVELYPREEFRRNGIEVRFLQMKNVRYPQSSRAYRESGEFHPNLSIIDVLMNCGKERTFELLSEFDLV